MSRYKKDFGDWGEETAAAYLTGKGYGILARKYYTSYGELDIIASAPDGKTIVFAEVKTRRSKKYGDAAMSISRSKIQSIIGSAQQYALENPSDADYRFDVIEVYRNGEEIELNHIENAFLDVGLYL